MNKKQLFDDISENYDRINDVISLFTHRFFRKKAISKISGTHKKILDLCCGTGDMSYLLNKKYPDAEITGIDFSPKMLEKAKKRLPNQTFIERDISNLPFEDNSFDLCVISFGLRNTNDLHQVLNEIYRVLKKDGIFFNLDLGKPNKFWNIFLKPYMNLIVPFLGKLAHGNSLPLKYFAHSNETFPSPDELEKIYTNMGFKQISRTDFLFGQVSCQICKKNL